MVSGLLILAALSAQPATGKAAYEEAQVLYNQGRFEEALPLFERAYELSGGRKSTVFALAQCHRALRHYDQALGYFREYAELDLTPDEAERVTNTISEIEALLAEEEARAQSALPEIPTPPPPPSAAEPTEEAQPEETGALSLENAAEVAPPERSPPLIPQIILGSAGVVATTTGIILGQAALSDASGGGTDRGLVTQGEVGDALIISGSVIAAGAVVWWLLDH